jgi:TM2 domain-containing membrane protein YozV
MRTALFIQYVAGLFAGSGIAAGLLMHSFIPFIAALVPAVIGGILAERFIKQGELEV